MSYCRWSSMNWKCDLYCYYSVGDFYQTHVSSRRIVGDVPEAPLQLIIDRKIGEWIRRQEEASKYLDNCKRVNIGLEYDGCSFEDKTPEEFKQTLLMLREAGYIFPDYVLGEIEKEIDEHAR